MKISISVNIFCPLSSMDTFVQKLPEKAWTSINCTHNKHFRVNLQNCFEQYTGISPQNLSPQK